MNKIIVLLTVLFLGLAFYGIASYFAVSPEQREQEKMKFLNDRNALEKQLVGKWQPFLNTYKYPHQLFSADASYLYRKSSGAISTTGTWQASEKDSILTIRSHKSMVHYKILQLQKQKLKLAEVSGDTLLLPFKLKKLQ